MKPDWLRLLVLGNQPASLRECYELLEAFVAALDKPTADSLSDSPATLDADQGARLGYLIMAARLIGGVRPHDSWTLLQWDLENRRDGRKDLVLLAADAGANPFDEVALHWGFRKGLDTVKLTQICEHGAS